MSASRHPVLFVLAALLIWYASLTRAYAAVFQSDLTLWPYAVQQTPRKPRPLVNYGLALVEAGDLQGARRAFERAQVLAVQPHIPLWDRNDTMNATIRDLGVITFMSVMRARP